MVSGETEAFRLSNTLVNLRERFTHWCYPVVTANTPRSRKSKGAKFQNEIRDLLLEKFSDQLEPDDIKTAVMGESGTDIKLSPAAQKLFQFAVEAKRCEKIALRQWWKQAKENSNDKLKPLVITKQNREEALVILSLQDFLDLL